MESTELLTLALGVAREAGHLIVQMRARGVAVADTKTSINDVVTAADLAAEDLIRERLLAARPDDGILGEEGDDVVGTSGVRWVIDPIDGTVNYLYGLGEYAVSIAAQVGGESVAAVVRGVAGSTSYAATLGGGATRDGRPLAVREPGEMEQWLVGTGFGYRADVRARQGAAVARLLPRVRDIRRIGSCALDLCHVAEGTLDAYVEEGPHLWDHAAGGLIAREAGARFEVHPGTGAHQGADLLVCAPAPRFEEFWALVGATGFRDS